MFILVLFCLCFALVFGFSFPNRSRENSLLVRFVFLNKFSGANFCVWQPYCHRVTFPPSRRGKCCPFFFTLCFFCPVRCLLSFFFIVPLFLGSLFGKIFGSELLFLGVGAGLACFGAVLPMLLLYYLLFRSRNCLEKIHLMSGLVFLGCLLSSFGCFADVVVFF